MNNGLVSKKRPMAYSKRKKTLKKKACELSILCDIPVCVFYCSPQGKVEISWPEKRDEVYSVLAKYLGKDDPRLSAILAAKNNKKVENKNNKKKIMKSNESWDERLDYLPEETLMDIWKKVNDKSRAADERLRKPQTMKTVVCNCDDGAGPSTLNLLGDQIF